MTVTPIGAGNHNTGFAGTFAGDGHRLGDRDRAEAAGIERVDLAARSGLGNRAGESLARRRAAARIDVVTDAGNPSTRRLRLRRRRPHDGNKRRR
ncbi:MAG: hypothetical protein WDN08_07760 [Rhizomicrobium sp.]